MTRLLCMRLGTGQSGATLATCILRDGSPRTQADMWSSDPSIDHFYRSSSFFRGGDERFQSRRREQRFGDAVRHRDAASVREVR